MEFCQDVAVHPDRSVGVIWALTARAESRNTRSLKREEMTVTGRLIRGF
jgi:hypothetical protein